MTRQRAPGPDDSRYSTATALEIVAARDALLLEALIAEREQGWPPPYDWAPIHARRAAEAAAEIARLDHLRPRLFRLQTIPTALPGRLAA